jgi:4'-phosphopantetheinyl transferase
VVSINPDNITSVPGELAISADEVHVWRVRLDDPVPDRAIATLSPDERERARRFRFEHLTRRFVAGRAALRAILARYTRLAAAEIEFSYSERGKPGLSTGETGGIAFNISHSEELALCAIAPGRRVGIDVERVRFDRDLFGIVERFLSPLESRSLRRLDPAVRQRASHVCWTRKEAFLKACGEGLAAIDSFDVSCAPDEPARVLGIRAPLVDRGRGQWTILDIEADEGFVASVVVEGTGCRIRPRQWVWTG